MPHSILEAVKQGIWDYEPDTTDEKHYSSTRALPGTDEKLAILAERARQGLPLWHPADRRSFDEANLD